MECRYSACPVVLLLLGMCLPSRCSAVSASDPLRLLQNISYPKAQVGPYSWNYYTAKVPSSASQVHFSFVKYWKPSGSNSSSGPLVCFSIGRPSVPPEPGLYFNNLTSAALAAALSLTSPQSGSIAQAWGHCAVLSSHDTVVLNSSTTSGGLTTLAGSWYLGVFSVADSTRFQSQMIQRGPVYTFDLSIVSYGCLGPTLGLFCGQPITELPLLPSSSPAALSSQQQGHQLLLATWQELPNQCLDFTQPEPSPPQNSPANGTAASGPGSESGALSPYAAYLLRLPSPLPLLEISVTVDTSSSLTSLAWSTFRTVTGHSFTLNASLLQAGTLPLRWLPTSLGTAANVSNLDAGDWVVVVGGSVNGLKREEAPGDRVCFTLRWRVGVCQPGWTGPGCQHYIQQLQHLVPPQAQESDLDAVFSRPHDVHWPPALWTSWFILNPDPPSPDATPTNAPSHPGSADVSSGWAYISITIPSGASGVVLTIDAKSESSSSLSALFANASATLNLTMLGRARGVPTPELSDVQAWGNLHRGKVSLEIQHPMEGDWVFAFHLSPSPALPPASLASALSSLLLRFTLHGCASHCSWHGSCSNFQDATKLTTISYCYCDRTHGGHDCSIELQTEEKHRRDVYVLVISNAAAALPSVWSYQHQAWAEWVVYSTAGAASAIYHSCDAGSWCAARYGTLQFADFFLSFLAVLATFVYCAGLQHKSKLAFSISAAILAAVIARDDTTSGWNLVLVIALGSCGLLLGWLLEFLPFCTASRHRHRAETDRLARRTLLQRAHTSFRNGLGLAKAVWDCFDKRFLFAGFCVLGLAGLGWFTETGSTYWFWHSLFHVSIFTSAFFFLCSVREHESQTKRHATSLPNAEEGDRDVAYEQTLQRETEDTPLVT